MNTYCTCIIHATCPSPCCKPLSMLQSMSMRMSMSGLHVYVSDTCFSPCSTVQDLQHGHAHVAWSWTCTIEWTRTLSMGSMGMDMQHGQVYAACPSPCFMYVSMLLYMSKSMLHVHVHPECPCCMFMSMLHVHVHAACSCPCCMFMSMLHAHIHAACPSTFFVSIPMLYAPVYAAWQCPCCMDMKIQHRHGLLAWTWTCSMGVDSSMDMELQHGPRHAP